MSAGVCHPEPRRWVSVGEYQLVSSAQVLVYPPHMAAIEESRLHVAKHALITWTAALEKILTFNISKVEILEPWNILR